MDLDWSDVADVVKAAAPYAGAALAGPKGAMVGRWVSEALGTEQTPEAVAAAVKNDPLAMVKLREVEATLEATAINARRDVVVAEATSESYLAANWRPITMLAFVATIIADAAGLISIPELTKPYFFDLVETGLVGYVLVRSGEKIARHVTGRGIYDNVAAKVRRR